MVDDRSPKHKILLNWGKYLNILPQNQSTDYIIYIGLRSRFGVVYTWKLCNNFLKTEVIVTTALRKICCLLGKPNLLESLARLCWHADLENSPPTVRLVVRDIWNCRILVEDDVEGSDSGAAVQLPFSISTKRGLSGCGVLRPGREDTTSSGRITSPERITLGLFSADDDSTTRVLQTSLWVRLRRHDDAVRLCWSRRRGGALVWEKGKAEMRDQYLFFLKNIFKIIICNFSLKKWYNQM